MVDLREYNIEVEYSKDGSRVSRIESNINNTAPDVHRIVYDKENKVFHMVDYIDIRGRRVKIMFDLDLDLNIVGFIYNDYEDGYDSIDEEYYKSIGGNITTETKYRNYISSLVTRLTILISKREEKYKSDNTKMLQLSKSDSKVRINVKKNFNF